MFILLFQYRFELKSPMGGGGRETKFWNLDDQSSNLIKTSYDSTFIKVKHL